MVSHGYQGLVHVKVITDPVGLRMLHFFDGRADLAILNAQVREHVTRVETGKRYGPAFTPLSFGRDLLFFGADGEHIIFIVDEPGHSDGLVTGGVWLDGCGLDQCLQTSLPWIFRLQDGNQGDLARQFLDGLHGCLVFRGICGDLGQDICKIQGEKMIVVGCGLLI